MATRAAPPAVSADPVAAERARILTELLGDMHNLVAGAVHAICTEIAAYGAQDERFVADVAEQVEAHYTTKLKAFREERTVSLD